jgi:CPA1 family monovalent cation:H+ antiporter
VVFLVFLPPILYFAGAQTSWRDFKANRRPIALLAVGLVLFTTAMVAVAAHYLIGMSWPAAFVLGAIVSPPDAVAATAIMSRMRIPKRIITILEGESLVNDATGLVTLRLAIAAGVTGTFSITHGIGEFFWASLGGVAVGAAAAWLASWLRRRLDDSLIEITITLLTPYAAFLAAEELDVSGVLAAVATGLVVAAYESRSTSATVRLQSRSFWDVLTFLLESTLFVLVGLQGRALFDDLESPGSELALAALALVAVVVGVRIVFAMTLRRLPVRERVVVGWAGMRGAISLAAALSIPLTTDAGAPFPERDMIIALTLLVIGATLIGQGLTLGWLTSRVLPPDASVPSERATAIARFDTVTAVLERIADVPPDSEIPAALVERARELYTTRAQQLAGACRLGVADEGSDVAAWLRFRVELLAVERSVLTSARDDGTIPNAVKIAVERELDLEEERLRGRMAA